MVKILSASGTIYFVDNSRGLLQRYELTVRNPGPAFEDRLRVRWSEGEFATEPILVKSGDAKAYTFIPDIRESVELSFSFAGRQCEPLTIKHIPRRHWTVHLIQFAHHDLGYTDLPSNVLREYCEFYDSVLQFCRETEDFPDESKFRYTIEQAWSLLYYLDHRSSEICEEMIKRIREGRIEVNALLGNMITELLGPEQMIRLLYPVFQLKRKYGIQVVCAEHNDIPGISWGLAAALAGAGIKWFAPALPDYFRWHDMNFHTFWDEDLIAPNGIPHVFYWEAPNGEKILFWYGRQGAGGDVDVGLSGLVSYLEKLESRGYPYDVLRYLIMGGFRDNAPPRVEFALTCRDWNSRWAYPKFLQSLNARFFPELERRLGSDVPTYRGEIPGTDYPVGACSTAYTLSLNRVTHDQLLAAERFACAAASLCDYKYPVESLREAYYCTLLGDEHTWGLAHPVGAGQEACVAQLSEYPYRAAALAHDVLTKAINEIADRIDRDEDGLYVVVFNPLNWQRTDIVSVPARPFDPCGRPMRPIPERSQQLDLHFAIWASYPVCDRGLIEIPHAVLKGGLEVVDTCSGERMAHEVYEICSPSAPVAYAAQRHALGQFHPEERLELRFVARNVPPCGWRLYRINPIYRINQTDSTTEVKSEIGVLENDFYRVELDLETGAIKSIVDKDLGCEIVDTSADYLLNQIVIRSSVTGEKMTSGSAVVERGRSSAVSTSVVVKTSAIGYPQIVQEIILYRDIKRLDIANRLLKDPTPMLETYFAFPFAIKEPRFRYEGALCQVEPFVDQFPGSNTDYYAVQHWAEVSNGQTSVVITSIDAPVMQFGDNWPLYVSQAHHGVMHPGFNHEFHTHEDIKCGHIYSLVLLNNFRTNFAVVQCGDLLFRYSITSGVGVNPSEFGYSVSLPLASATVNGKTEGVLPACASFFQVDHSNVILLSVKFAEDGDGLVVRLLETQGRYTDLVLTFPMLKVSDAFETNAVEEILEKLDVMGNTVRIHVRPYSIATIKFTTHQT
ncbi:MAG: glycosyl hydrolase-related protein [Armatimonadota bacterium]